MNTITTEEAVRLIYQSGGRAFAATFTKRTDGSLRTIGAGSASTSPLFPPTRTDTQPRSLPPCGDSYMRTPMCLILCSSREPKQLLLHLTKRSHGCQRVHIVPPLHDLSALDGNDRDEPVVV